LLALLFSSPLLNSRRIIHGAKVVGPNENYVYTKLVVGVPLKYV
jgi:hypothetical protein